MMLNVSDIPEQLRHLRDAVILWNTEQDDLNMPDKFRSNLEGFAKSYQIDVFNMDNDDMVLLNHRIAYFLG